MFIMLRIVWVVHRSSVFFGDDHDDCVKITWVTNASLVNMHRINRLVSWSVGKDISTHPIYIHCHWSCVHNIWFPDTLFSCIYLRYLKISRILCIPFNLFRTLIISMLAIGFSVEIQIYTDEEFLYSPHHPLI